MSWAAHEFENYFLQSKVKTRASFFALVLGALSPDLFTKFFVYQHAESSPLDAARFHRGWPGMGFSHSLIFGVFLALVVLAVTKSRAWALGVIIGQWAHVLTDVADSAGVMPFFPFSTQNVSVNMWRHAASQGKYGDAVAYFSSLGMVWDAFWLLVTVIFAWRTLTSDYFRAVVMPADPQVWGWLQRRARLPESALLLLYRGWLFYGAGRWIAWFLFARFNRDYHKPVDLSWGGPFFVPRTPVGLTGAGPVEVLWRTALGGVLFAVFLCVGWRLLGRRLWARGRDTPIIAQAKALRAAQAAPRTDPDPEPDQPVGVAV